MTAFQAEGCGIAPWAMSIKSALRDWLSMSYSMISILRIGSLRSPPPIQLRRTSPYAGAEQNTAKHFLHKRLYSKHRLLCPLEEGERWWRQPPKGECISSSGARLACFPTPAGRYKKWRRRRRTSPVERYFIPPEGGALNPSGRRQPIPDRTLGAQGQRPGGAITPHARKGVSTFGNTGKHRPGHPFVPIYFR